MISSYVYNTLWNAGTTGLLISFFSPNNSRGFVVGAIAGLADSLAATGRQLIAKHKELKDYQVNLIEAGTTTAITVATLAALYNIGAETGALFLYGALGGYNIVKILDKCHESWGEQRYQLMDLDPFTLAPPKPK